MKYLYCVWCAVALINCSLECFRILQNTSYRPQRGYAKIVFSWYYLVLILAAAVSWIWQVYFRLEVVLCGFYTLLAIPLVLVKHKTPLKFTKRIWRMLAVEFALLLVACYFALHWWIAFLPIFALVAYAFCLPADLMIARVYFKRAQSKLFASNVTVIAITGSYGKTSTKDMLASLLSDSIAPKGSCNTPLGIAAYINATDLSRHKFLILEFGARKKGDIAQLCHIYKPKFGIITGVCEQHLSTFRNLQNILSTKGELAENLPSDGLCLLGDASVCKLLEVGACKKQYADVTICNLRISPNGIDFDATLGNKTSLVHLPQITAYSAGTFALCATMCNHLGQNFDETVKNAQFVRQTPHRMEISHNGAFYIIDDSYNGSVRGVEGCVELLAQLSGIKVAICQGIVECGNDRKKLNEWCGESLGGVCDVVIVLGKNSQMLKLGAQKAGCKVVLEAKNLQNAVQLAQSYLVRDSFLLFQNDLPDVVYF